jgi:hypothetical protein
VTKEGPRTLGYERTEVVVSLRNRPAWHLHTMAASASASATSSSQIFSVNPYENHPSLTQIEADVLWEYAKLNQHIKDVRISPTFDRELRPIVPRRTGS